MNIPRKLTPNDRKKLTEALMHEVKTTKFLGITSKKTKDEILKDLVGFQCHCEGLAVEFGMHENQVRLDAPTWSTRGVISVDKCLAEEILYLWSEGVITSGCCCGHGIEGLKPMINVFSGSFCIMEKLGYESFTNEFGTRCFIPKGVV